MPIKTITWKIEPHTEVKHAILRKYLDAWIPIISKFKRANYIDGFAGAGKYSGGEDGSPIIAIKSLIEHKLINNINAEFNFLFIEEDSCRCNNLLSELSKMNISIPQNIKIKTQVICGEFNEKLNEIFDALDNQNSSIAPTFVFIDPFGIKGVSINTIKRIMSKKSCEVFINFMYEELNRFINLPTNETHIKELFGDDIEWRKVKLITCPKERYNFLTSLYETQLRSLCNIKHIRTFKMINKFNKDDYVLFFCTNEDLGLKKMKEAMWRVDSSGNFNFSDATYNPAQLTLFEVEPNYAQLKKLILNRFKGNDVSIESLENFIWFETPFLVSHLRKPILDLMEKSNEIKTTCIKNRRACTYPEGTIIHFN